ncbi:MAG TPA: group III truncated hemoglobin [Pseudolabrys sp.]|nr:group III truncated hemoglobin [Pseudolabrys sp.]
MATKRGVTFDRVDEDTIRQLIDAFYSKVRADALLGPIFAHAIPGDWGPHLATMRNFWSSVMLTSGRYKGNPVAVHKRLAGVEIGMFDRWLALFGETCRELFAPELAAEFADKAARIAESLKLAMFYRPDRPWPLTVRKDEPENAPESAS